MQSKLSNDTNTSPERELEEITVIVSGNSSPRHKRFMGYRLIRWLQPMKHDQGTEILCVYSTAGKQYALRTRAIPDWDFSEGDPDYWGNPDNWELGHWARKLMFFGWDWETFKVSGDYSLQVFKTLEDLRAHVSDDLYRAVIEAIEEPDIEELDI